MTWNKREDGKGNPDAELSYHWNQMDVDSWRYKTAGLSTVKDILEFREKYKNLIKN